LIKINTRALSVAAEHPARLAPLQGAIWMKFFLEDPLDGDKTPRPVAQ
jgi:hypothetical protein